MRSADPPMGFAEPPRGVAERVFSLFQDRVHTTPWYTTLCRLFVVIGLLDCRPLQERRHHNCRLGLGAIRDQSGVNLGSIRGPCGIEPGTIWGPSGGIPEDLACLGFSGDLVMQSFCHTAAYPKPVDVTTHRTLPKFIAERGGVALRPGDGIIHSWLNRMLLPDQARPMGPRKMSLLPGGWLSGRHSEAEARGISRIIELLSLWLLLPCTNANLSLLPLMTSAKALGCMQRLVAGWTAVSLLVLLLSPPGYSCKSWLRRLLLRPL